ncbi:QacE family quaternary ammonium compound efflux SMR transporter [Vibrio sp. Y2-5]|uniref:DMT family transporter n=1 Tax=Vibrio TaxID=662 RepID=UPI00142E3D45|nr:MULTISPECIES: SMR family transporter [Vibrio]MBD0785545.1 QacE family quaternary ammonium compound efflux SMR transporter [Vibrio sp. Y2-5]NIY93438.1 QacE family quaternary ammonium compound efflux SMR transporter [Vibrio diazotrophicus]
MLALPPLATLMIAILLEVIATSYLPKTNQFTSLPVTAGVLITYALAFYFLSITVNAMSLGIAYAIWCGVGIVLVASISWLIYGQKLDIYAIVGMSFILMGTVIINVYSTSVNH